MTTHDAPHDPPQLSSDDPIEAIQRAEQAERMAAVSDFSKPPKKRRRWPRVVLGLLLVLLVVVGLAPSVAGPMLRPVIEKRLTAALAATVRIERVSLSWVDGPRIEGVRILDEALQEQANLTIRSGTQLFRLAMNPSELGKVYVSGSMILERRPDGSIAPFPKPDPNSGTSFSLPDLSVILNAENLDLEWRETDREPVRISGIDGGVSYGPGTVAGGFTFDIEHALGTGEADVSFDVHDLASEDGTIAAESGGVTIKVEGDVLRLDLGADVTRTDSGYRVSLLGDEAEAHLGGRVIAALAPEFAQLTRAPVEVGDGRAFTMDAVPGASLRLTRAAATIDPGTGSLADTRFEAVLETDRLTGTLDGARWTIEPLLATAGTRNLADGLDVEAVTSVTLDGTRAGDPALRADGLRALDVGGAVVTEPTTILAGSRTTLDVTEVVTAVIEPLVASRLAGTGLVLSRDLGPVVSAEFALTSGPRTGLRLGLDSSNAEASLGFVIEEGVLRSTEDASRVRIRSASGVLSELLSGAGVRVDQGADVDLRLSEFAIDLAAQQEDRPLDLRSLTGVVQASIGRTSGTLPIDGAEQRFVLRPSEAEIDLRRITERATLVAGAAVEIDARQAGSMNISIDATDLLDERGALRGGVPSLSGEIALRNLRGDLLDLWFARAGIPASGLLGESADLLVVGTRQDDTVRLQTSLDSGGFAGGGDLTIVDRVIESSGPMRFEHPSASRLVTSILPDSLAPGEGGSASVEIKAIRFGPDGLTALDASLGLDRLSVMGPSGRGVLFERLDASATIDGARGSVEINGLGSVGESPLLAGGRLAFLTRAQDTDTFDVWRSSPEGRIDLTLPAMLAEVLAPDAVTGWRDVLELAVGDTIEVAFIAGEQLTLEAAGTSGATSARLDASFDAGSLAITSGTLRTRITEEAVRQLRLERLARSGVSVQGPVLTSQAELELSLSGFGLLEKGRLAPTGSTAIRLTASGTVEGLRPGTVMGSDGLPRRVRTGEIGIEGLIVEGELPVGAILGGEAAELTGSMRGTATGEGGAPIGQLTGTVAAGFASGALAGPISVSVELPDVDTALIDDSLHTDSFFSGLLGAGASVSLELAGLGEAGRVSDAGLSLAIDAPRLSTDAPVVLDIRPDRIELAHPIAAHWKLDPVFATRHLMNQRAGLEQVKLAETFDMRIGLEELTLGRGGKPFRPDVFNARVDLAAPRLWIDQREEVAADADASIARWIRSDLSPVTGQLVSAEGEGATLTLTAAEGAEQSLLARLNLRGVNVGRPTLNVLIEGRRIPTQCVDGAAGLEGALAEMIGPFTQIRLAVQDLTRDSGSVNVSVVGERASARLFGRVEDGVFRNEDPLEVQVDVIRPQLGSRISRAVPALGRVTKSREDGPATLTATSIELPITDEQPLRGLDADFIIDIGTARFRASRAFGDLLLIAQQKTDTEVGRKLEPMTGTVRDGLLSYERLKLPLGEFTLTSEGTYDLLTKQVDVVTSVPLGALSDRAMGDLNTGLGTQLSRLLPGVRDLTMVPWRVTGVPGELRIQPDIEEFSRQLTRTLNPVNILGNVFGV